MKVISVIGARPQFIKSGPVSRELRRLATELVVHTGQHYDQNMCEVFFRDLGLPKPNYNLEVGSGSHGYQTAEMLKKLEDVYLQENPDFVLVYGDTNSTIAAALAAVKLHIPVCHVEAGLRSFNRKMPEEVNRVVTDHLSDLLFCPTDAAVENLAHEGIAKGVYLVGDVMYDSLLDNLQVAKSHSPILNQLDLKPHSYVLATVHRAENTDDTDRLTGILDAFSELGNSGLRIVFPVHPRTKKRIFEIQRGENNNFQLLDPVSYLDMLCLESQSSVILTDSGGVQKEAFWLRVPCVTLRHETEWIETVATQWNVLVGTDSRAIVNAVQNVKPGNPNNWPWQKGEASRMIAEILAKGLNG